MVLFITDSVLLQLIIIIIINLFGWTILVPYLRRHPRFQQVTTDTPQFLLIFFIPFNCMYTYIHVASYIVKLQCLLSDLYSIIAIVVPETSMYISSYHYHCAIVRYRRGLMSSG